MPNEPIRWYFLAHLGYNMWGDPIADWEDVPSLKGGGARRVLQFDETLFFGVAEAFRRAGGDSIVNQKTSETGGVYLTVPALTDLCARYLSSITEISVSRIGVMPQEDKTLKIDCDISMKPETDIPLMTEKIDREMREYIERYSGVNVSAVNIRVLPFKQPKQQ